MFANSLFWMLACTIGAAVCAYEYMGSEDVLSLMGVMLCVVGIAFNALVILNAP